MDSYAKVFASIIHSTVWQEPLSTRIVWITMLVLADRDGLVSASVGGLARAANVSREQCETALASFLAPDPDSKTTANEGRRIERVEGGWKLLNYETYRDLKSPDDVRSKNAARQQRLRDRRKVTLRNGSNVTNNDVTPSSDLISGSGSSHSQDPEKPRENAVADPDLHVQAPPQEQPPPAVPPPSPAEWHEKVPPRGHLQPVATATPAFSRAFKAYPGSGVGRLKGAAAFQHFAQHHPGGAEGFADELVTAIARIAKSGVYTAPGFWPKFEKFIEDRLWLDEPSANPRGPPRNGDDRGEPTKSRYTDL